jgi:Cdc6-like AAA superfamily ATPase
MSLITNDQVLEIEIPPDEMLLRDEKMDHIKSILKPI